MSHGLKLTKYVRIDPTSPQWPSFTGTAQFSGTSADGLTSVWYDSSLGDQAAANAASLVADAPRINISNTAIFGTPAGATNVIIFALGGMTDGTGGADHMGCDYQTGNAIEVCAAFGNDMMVSALFEAELSECAMNGNLCGLSTGEALSRWCAMVIGNNALASFASAPTWAQNGYQNWVDKTDQTDQNYDSIGCGMAFLSWLQALGYPFSRIAQLMVYTGNSGTLAEIYASLIGQMRSTAWPAFMAGIKALPGGVVSDDPFGALSMPTPQPAPAPIPAPLPHKPSHSLAKIKQDLTAIVGRVTDPVIASLVMDIEENL